MTNWYNKSKLTKPYIVFLDCGVSRKRLGTIDVAESDEGTEVKQAKAIAYKKYFDLISDYTRTNFLSCVLKAELDKEEWQRSLDIQRIEKEKEDDTVQNAWWND